MEKCLFKSHAEYTEMSESRRLNVKKDAAPLQPL